MHFADDAGKGVWTAPEGGSLVEEVLLHLLAEVDVEEAGVEAAPVQLLHHGERVRGRGHVDEPILVDDDNVDDCPEPREERPKIRRIYCDSNIVHENRIKSEGHFNSLYHPSFIVH